MRQGEGSRGNFAEACAGVVNPCSKKKKSGKKTGKGRVPSSKGAGTGRKNTGRLVKKTQNHNGLCEVRKWGGVNVE